MNEQQGCNKQFPTVTFLGKPVKCIVQWQLLCQYSSAVVGLPLFCKTKGLPIIISIIFASSSLLASSFKNYPLCNVFYFIETINFHRFCHFKNANYDCIEVNSVPPFLKVILIHCQLFSFSISYIMVWTK